MDPGGKIGRLTDHPTGLEPRRLDLRINASTGSRYRFGCQWQPARIQFGSESLIRLSTDAGTDPVEIQYRFVWIFGSELLPPGNRLGTAILPSGNRLGIGILPTGNNIIHNIMIIIYIHIIKILIY